jgi:hypothetical protein
MKAKINGPPIFQRLLWHESIWAVKESLRFTNFQNFRNHLEENLPQNSQYVRKRYTRSILYWFFPDRSLETLPALVWKAYHDDRILNDIMRYLYLVTEKIVAEFLLEYILPLTPGTVLPDSYFEDYLKKKYGVVKKDPKRCLRFALRDLGFIQKNTGQSAIVQSFSLPKTAMLILIHYLFAQRPQSVSLKNILAHNFWRLLGIRETEDAKKILKEAYSKGLISKYIIADQLEQVTTKFTLKEFFDKKMKL